MTNLIVLAGVPGCGKSTWAKTFLDLKYAIVSSDAIRKRLAGSLRAAHDEKIKPWDVFYNEIETKLLHGVDVVADATFLTKRHREQARLVAGFADVDCNLFLFKNLQEAWERNLCRDEDTRVPSQVMADMQRLYWDTLSALEGGERGLFETVTMIERFQ